ncbi:MAG: general secretion pathway protein GspK [Methylomonas sp.]|nr:MAG: general secretion pathway protein GspK [Methylomonas sp.]
MRAYKSAGCIIYSPHPSPLTREEGAFTTASKGGGYFGRKPKPLTCTHKAGSITDAQTGVALITVLLVLALATVAVVSMSSERQLDIRRSENMLRNNQAWEYAHSLEQWAMQRLQDQQGFSQPQVSIEENGGVAMHAELDDLQSKLNLNNLIVEGRDSPNDVKRLQRLLKQLKLPVELTDAILDWLDADSDIRYPFGAEDEVYSRKNPPYRTSNRWFSDVSELMLVQGFSRPMYETLRPYVYAVEGYAPINVNTAKPEILRCLADDISKDRAESIYRAAGKPFRKLTEFLQDEAVNDSGIGKHGLTVTSQFYQLTGTVEQGRLKLGFLTQLSKQNEGLVTVIRRQRTGWSHG